MERTLHAQFDEDGFIVVRGLIAPPDVDHYIARLRALAGGAERWTEPGGVNGHREFWPIIFNERLLETVRGIFGPVRFLPHTDLHVGFSSFSWHRDSVTRTFGEGSDWEEGRVPYRIARVGIYLQRFDESQFRIGFVRGSHRLGALTPER